MTASQKWVVAPRAWLARVCARELARLSRLCALLQAELQAAIARAKMGRTALIIAHRLSTTRDADEILVRGACEGRLAGAHACVQVLEGGVVVERGKHEDLVAREGGKYAALWNQQVDLAGATPALSAEVKG